MIGVAATIFSSFVQYLLRLIFADLTSNRVDSFGFVGCEIETKQINFLHNKITVSQRLTSSKMNEQLFNSWGPLISFWRHIFDHKSWNFRFTNFSSLLTLNFYLRNFTLVLSFTHQNRANFSLREQVWEWYQGAKFFRLIYDPPTHVLFLRALLSVPFFAQIRSALDARASSTITRVGKENWEEMQKEVKQKAKKNWETQNIRASSASTKWAENVEAFFLSFFVFFLFCFDFLLR